jgi:hypothetical protein
MKGLGKRVTVAFLSVVALLVAAGVISLFELSDLSYDTSEMLAVTGRDMESTKSLFAAAHNHRRAMVDIVMFDDDSGKKACSKALKEVEKQIASARNGASATVRASLDTLAVYGAQLQKLAEGYRKTELVTVAEPANKVAEADSVAVATAVEAAPTTVEQPVDARRWFKEKYDPAYDRFIAQLERYSTLSSQGLTPRHEQLSDNAYRSVMPVLISLAVMIAIVLMLYYFIYIYGVNPIKRMNRSLADHISFKLPYKAKAEMIDEIKELNDNIENLINLSKSNKN